MGAHKATNYLFRPSAFYHFRFVIPSDLRGVVGLREIRYALKTGNYGIARLRGLKLATFLLPLIEQLRKGYMKELSDTQIQQLIRNHFRESLERDERERISSPARTYDETQEEYSELVAVKETYADSLQRSDYRFPQIAVDRMLTGHKIDLAPESFSYRKLCREYAKGVKRSASFYLLLPGVSPERIEIPQ